MDKNDNYLNDPNEPKKKKSETEKTSNGKKPGTEKTSKKKKSGTEKTAEEKKSETEKTAEEKKSETEKTAEEKKSETEKTSKGKKSETGDTAKEKKSEPENTAEEEKTESVKTDEESEEPDVTQEETLEDGGYPENYDYSDYRKIKVSVSSSVGCVRERNEDNFYADEFGMRLEPEDAFTGELYMDCRRIFAVCDGMGGEDFGDDASEISAGVIEFYKTKIRESAPEELHRVINAYAIKANNEVWEMVRRQQGYQSGSTLAMAIVDEDAVNVFNIGDSRVYFYKDKKLEQITEDQTLAMKKFKENIYTEEQAKNSPDCHRITNFIGIDEFGMGPEAVHTGTFPSDHMMILICSDGLTDMCCDEEIADILSEKMENHADALVDRALENGGVDNVTCVVISF